MAAAGRMIRRRGGMLGGGVVLGLVAWRLGSGPFLRALQVVDARVLVIGLLIGLATTVLSAWRWVLVARGLGIRLPLRDAVSDYYRSLFLNAVLPGGVLGDVHRAVRHGKDVGDVALAAKAVVLERVAGQIVLLVTGAAVLGAGPLVSRFPAVERVGGPAAGVVLAAVVLVLAALVVGVALRPVVTAVLRGRVRGDVRGGVPGDVRGRLSGPGPAGARALRALAAWAGQVRQGLFSRGNRGRILLASAAVLAGHLAMFVVAARAAGSTVPVGRLIPLLLLALIAMGLPLNVGGWGPREAVTTWGFAAAGLNAGQGLTMAVVYGLLALVASLPGAVLPLLRRLGVRGLGGAALAGPARPTSVPITTPTTPIMPVTALTTASPATPISGPVAAQATVRPAARATAVVLLPVPAAAVSLSTRRAS